MNVNYFVKCRICNTFTRIRIPLGYINEFPIRIHCGTCRNIISGHVRIGSNEPDCGINFDNVDVFDEGTPRYFAEVSGELPCNKVENCENKNFMDYATRMPGLNSIIQVGFHNKDKFTKNITDLSNVTKRWKDIDVIFNLFKNGKKEYIIKLLKELNKKEYLIENDIEVHREVHYTFLKLMKYIFVKEDLKKYILNINKEISIIDMEQYNKLINFLDEKNFLEKAYNEILDMLFKFMDILPNLIPAISAMQYKCINYEEQGISTCSFEDIKTFYIDAYEKILSLIQIPICLDNIKYRGEYNKFSSSKNYENFIKKKKGNKLKEISKEEFFSSMVNFPIDNKLRNAIGHSEYEFDGISQNIKYIPDEKQKEIVENKYLIIMAMECVQLMQYMVILEDLIFQLIWKKNLNKGLKLKVDDVFYKEIKVNEKCPCGSGKKYKKCCKD